MSDEYSIALATTDGRFISSENASLKPGLTFKAVRIVRPTEASLSSGGVPRSTPAISPPAATTVYFDQSRYELRPQAKATLDSIAHLLVEQVKLTVRVTGYTDNVGERALNLTLSEYRARTVETYLKQRGVLANQIMTGWKGPDGQVSTADEEATKTKSRRVVLEFSAK